MQVNYLSLDKAKSFSGFVTFFLLLGSFCHFYADFFV